MVHNVTSGVDLKPATEELNQFSKGLMGMILGMIAPKVSSPSKTIHNSPLLRQCLRRESNPYTPCEAPDFKVKSMTFLSH